MGHAKILFRPRLETFGNAHRNHPAYLKDATERYKKGLLKKNPAILPKRLDELIFEEQKVAAELLERPQRFALGGALGECIKTLGDPERPVFRDQMHFLSDYQPKRAPATGSKEP
jgi:hypothetical protein